MKYENLRKSINTGDLFFTASRSFFGWLIRFFTRSKVSHVGVFVWIYGRLFIVEAVEGKGVVMELSSTRIINNFSWWGKTKTEKSETEIREFALSSLGEEYDMVGALLSLFYNTNSSAKFCSEFAAEALGISFPYSERGITPSDLRLICEKSFKKIECSNK